MLTVDFCVPHVNSKVLTSWVIICEINMAHSHLYIFGFVNGRVNKQTIGNGSQTSVEQCGWSRYKLKPLNSNVYSIIVVNRNSWLRGIVAVSGKV